MEFYTLEHKIINKFLTDDNNKRIFLPSDFLTFTEPQIRDDYILYVGASIFNIIIALFPITCKNVHLFKRTDRKEPDKSGVHWSRQNYASSLWKLFHIIIAAHGMWTLILLLWKSCGALGISTYLIKM